MSSPRVIGLVSIVAGALVLVFGVSALVSVVQLSVVQPIVIAGGGGLVLVGAQALKADPPSKNPPQPSLTE